MTDFDTTTETTSVRAISFDAVFSENVGFVGQCLRRLGVRSAELEDVTHEVFVAVYRKLGDYDAGRPLRAWLFGFAYHTALRYKDLARHEREVFGEMPEMTDESPSSEDRAMASQTRTRLQRALDTLPIEQRAVFVLHDIEDAAMPEVAETLGMPLNTAYSRLRIARAKLKRLLAAEREGAM